MDTASSKWVIRKKAVRSASGDTLDSVEDMGRREHVQKVLAKNFPGIDLGQCPAVWKQEHLTLLFDLGTEKRVGCLEVEVRSSFGPIADAITILSPRFRRIGTSNFWGVFDDGGNEIQWSPPKPKPRQKKGLVNVHLTPEKLLEHCRAGTRASCWFGGLRTVKELDEFLHSVSRSIDRERGKQLYPSSVGWTNLEVATPSGGSFFKVDFGGEHGDGLREIYVASARSLGLRLAAFGDESLLVEGELQPFALAECTGVLHFVWASTARNAIEQGVQSDGHASGVPAH